MSAECNKCGCDIVYPVGTWPIGECPNCEKDKTIERLKLEVKKWKKIAESCRANAVKEINSRD